MGVHKIIFFSLELPVKHILQHTLNIFLSKIIPLKHIHLQPNNHSIEMNEFHLVRTEHSVAHLFLNQAINSTNDNSQLNSSSF